MMRRPIPLYCTAIFAFLLHKPITSKYTYTEDVFPIFNQRCSACHVAGGVAPMSLVTYKDAVPWAESIRSELIASHMPPRYDLNDSHRLSPRELDVLLTWATGGTPQGPAKRLPVVTLKNEWKSGAPDLVLPIPSPFTLAADKLEETREFVVQSGASEDRWIKGVDLLPGAPSMVRHAVIFTRSSDSKEQNVLALWVPGETLGFAPAGTSFRWPARTELVVRIRYRKTWKYEGTPLTDRSAVGIYLLPRAPQRELRSVPLGGLIEEDLQAVALRSEGGTPDKVIRIEAVRPDGSRVSLITLLARPDWDRRYWFARPIALPRGTRINITGNPSRVWLDVAN